MIESFTQNTMNKYKESAYSYLESSKSKQDAEAIFEGGVLVSKFAMLIGLLVISFINCDVAFLSTHPQSFLGECVMIGMSAVASTALLGSMRGANVGKIIQGMFIAFLVFFIFHLLMEMSGMNNVETRNINKVDESQQKFLDKTVLSKYTIGAIGIGGAIMTLLSTKVEGLKNHSSKRNAVEGCLFALINSIPAYFITKNRGEESHGAVVSMLKTSVLYGGVYLVLQNGGFFDHIMPKG
jgi:hypothetical protein